ncbi:MAG: hypothetical protein N3H30_02710 [Candidatus Micrarchaeota archaeon]|nr:hypothetical protein [Candidatus Micrarchaeota archaeon]
MQCQPSNRAQPSDAKAGAYATRKRGQMFAMDLIVAILLLLAILMLVLSVQGDVMGREGLASLRVDMAHEAQGAAQRLLYAPAQPTDWPRRNISLLQSPNIISSPGVLDWEKAKALSNSSYNDTREALGVSSQIYVRIMQFNSSQVYLSFGQQPPATSTLYRVERPILINGTVGRVVIEVWRELG